MKDTREPEAGGCCPRCGKYECVCRVDTHKTVANLRKMMTDHAQEMSSDEFWTLSDASLVIESLEGVVGRLHGLAYACTGPRAEGQDLKLAQERAKAYGSAALMVEGILRKWQG